MSRQGEPLRGVQVEAWKAKVPDLGEGEAPFQSRLRRGEYGLGFGRFAITVQQVFDEERGILCRRARRLLRCLGHRAAGDGCGLDARDHRSVCVCVCVCFKKSVVAAKR